MKNFNIERYIDKYSIYNFLDKIYDMAKNETIKDFIYYLNNKGISTLLNDFDDDGMAELFEDIVDYSQGYWHSIPEEFQDEDNKYWDNDEGWVAVDCLPYIIYEFDLSKNRWLNTDNGYGLDNRHFKAQHQNHLIKIKIDSKCIYLKWGKRYVRFPFEQEENLFVGMPTKREYNQAIDDGLLFDEYL